MSKGQSWSMDLVIAVVIFGFIAVIFYSLVLIQSKPSVEDLQREAQGINTKLEGTIPGCGTIIEGQTVTPQLLQCLFSQNYTQLKQQLGIKANFCLYVEDSNGKLYIVNNGTSNLTGFGDPELVVSGTPCGQSAP